MDGDAVNETTSAARLDVIKRALAATEAGDLDAMLACLADDAVVELPYAQADSGTSIDKPSLGRLVSFLIQTFDTRRFGIDRVYEPAGGDTLIVEYHSAFTAKAAAVDYANRYITVYEFRDGLITLWREYANPLAFEAAIAAIKAASP